MKTATVKISKILSRLVRKNSDAEKCFERAKEMATAKTLTDWFRIRTSERSMFRNELRSEICSLDYSYVKAFNSSEGLSQAWMVFKATLTGDNDEVILDKAIRGEWKAFEDYNAVLTSFSLSTSTKRLLTEHRIKIEHGLSILNTLDEIKYHEEY